MSRGMSAAAALLSACLLFFCLPARANVYGSVEPIPNHAVADVGVLEEQPLAVRSEFAELAFQCGFVAEVVDALASTGAISTINELNTSVSIGAGGFAGHTNPSYVLTFLDDGPNAASHEDIVTFTNGLAYVLSQGSAFLLDSDAPSAFDFPANYLVVNFPLPPSIAESAALFETVGRIDPELFLTDTSGFTQFGRAYLALQPDVDDEQFIAGYREASAEMDLEYAPLVDGQHSLFRGGAAFPGNDWSLNEEGEEYLGRIPAESHHALGALRERHLRLTDRFLRSLEPGAGWSDRLAAARLRSNRVPCR